MKEFPNIIPKHENWPITEFYKDRPRVVKKLTQETVDYFKKLPLAEQTQILSQTIYLEKLRVKLDPLKVDPPNENVYWKKLEADMSEAIAQNGQASALYEEILTKICHRYAEEITGNFHPKTFSFLRRILTFLFKMIYNPFYSKKGGAFWGSKEALLDKFNIIGPLDHIRTLFDKGTVVVVPTHFSNLDSILIGYAIEMLTGLPAFSYGAGLNLYDYELLAYYMSRAGAYKVDRRKKNPIYSQSTKQYSTISIQEGLNGIFFPGGTRSRNGTLEKTLKMGLLSTLIDSQNEFYLRNHHKKIIIVPLVISYHFVFEAEALIDQHLKRTGKENYLAKKRTKSTSFKSLRMLYRFFKSESRLTLSFGSPIDIFGNQLDEQARSVKHNKSIDIKEYFKTDGQLSYDGQRNRVYTRHLADELVKSYSKENVVLTSHLVTFTAFQMFKKMHSDLDIFGLLNLPVDYFSISIEDFTEQLELLINQLMTMERNSEINLCEEIKNGNAKEITTDGIRNINVYHFIPPLKIENNALKSDNLKLLYYYNNRLEGYGLDKGFNKKVKRSLRLTKSTF